MFLAHLYPPTLVRWPWPISQVPGPPCHSPQVTFHRRASWPFTQHVNPLEDSLPPSPPQICPHPGIPCSQQDIVPWPCPLAVTLDLLQAPSAPGRVLGFPHSPVHFPLCVFDLKNPWVRKAFSSPFCFPRRSSSQDSGLDPPHLGSGAPHLSLPQPSSSSSL